MQSEAGLHSQKRETYERSRRMSTLVPRKSELIWASIVLNAAVSAAVRVPLGWSCGMHCASIHTVLNLVPLGERRKSRMTLSCTPSGLRTRASTREHSRSPTQSARTLQRHAPQAGTVGEEHVA